MSLAIEGWFALGDDGAYLIGTRCSACGAIAFPPRHGLCRDPRCDSETMTEIPLSRRGRIWSYTNACYPPPEPFVAAHPYTPVTLAAVELAEEGIVVLGQVRDLTVDDLEVGMELELTHAPLADGPLVWMWGRPA